MAAFAGGLACTPLTPEEASRIAWKQWIQNPIIPCDSDIPPVIKDVAELLLGNSKPNRSKTTPSDSPAFVNDGLLYSAGMNRKERRSIKFNQLKSPGTPLKTVPVGIPDGSVKEVEDHLAEFLARQMATPPAPLRAAPLDVATWSGCISYPAPPQEVLPAHRVIPTVHPPIRSSSPTLPATLPAAPCDQSQSNYTAFSDEDETNYWTNPTDLLNSQDLNGFEIKDDDDEDIDPPPLLDVASVSEGDPHSLPTSPLQQQLLMGVQAVPSASKLSQSEHIAPPALWNAFSQ